MSQPVAEGVMEKATSSAKVTKPGGVDHGEKEEQGSGTVNPNHGAENQGPVLKGLQSCGEGKTTLSKGICAQRRIPEGTREVKVNF